MLGSAAAAPETLAPLLDQGARSDTPATASSAPTLVTDRVTLTIESLVPVRGHILEAARTTSIAQLKVLYLERLQEETRALASAAAASNGVASGETRPPSGHSWRAKELYDPTIHPEFETHCRLIFDGIEVWHVHQLTVPLPNCMAARPPDRRLPLSHPTASLATGHGLPSHRVAAQLADTKLLSELDLGDAPRLLALSTRSKRGFAHRTLHSAIRWWPLLAVVLLAASIAFEVRQFARGSVRASISDTYWL